MLWVWKYDNAFGKLFSEPWDPKPVSKVKTELSVSGVYVECPVLWVCWWNWGRGVKWFCVFSTAEGSDGWVLFVSRERTMQARREGLGVGNQEGTSEESSWEILIAEEVDYGATCPWIDGWDCTCLACSGQCPDGAGGGKAHVSVWQGSICPLEGWLGRKDWEANGEEGDLEHLHS